MKGAPFLAYLFKILSLSTQVDNMTTFIAKDVIYINTLNKMQVWYKRWSTIQYRGYGLRTMNQFTSPIVFCYAGLAVLHSSQTTQDGSSTWFHIIPALIEV